MGAKHGLFWKQMNGNSRCSTCSVSDVGYSRNTLVPPRNQCRRDQSDWSGGSCYSHLQTTHDSLWTCSPATRGGTRSAGSTVGCRHTDRASTWQQSMLEAPPRVTKAYLGSSSGDWCWSLYWRGMGHCHLPLPMEGATTPAGPHNWWWWWYAIISLTTHLHYIKTAANNE